MPLWAWIILAVVVVLVAGFAVWSFVSKRRTERLQETFGPEYRRTLEAEGDRRRAESALEERRERREGFDIRPLGPGARDRYAAAWKEAQARFVDGPEVAIRDADRLVGDVMRERGYPMDDFDRQADLVSVDHPHVVENYRTAHAIFLRSEEGAADTEDLRRAMIHYRSLFDELVETEEVPRAQEA